MKIILLFFFVVFSAQNSNKIDMYRGNYSFNKEDYDEAVHHYLKGVSNNPNEFGIQYNIGNALYRKKQYSDAIAAYKKALKNAETEEQKKSALYNLGNAQYKNNQKKDAVESYKEALKLDKGNEFILKNLRIAQRDNATKDDSNMDSNENKGERDIDRYSPKKDKFKEDREDSGDSNSEDDKELEQEKKLEKQLLDFIEEKERNASKRALNRKEGYSKPRSNQKDW